MRIYGWGYNEECQLGVSQQHSNNNNNQDLQDNISVNCISNLQSEIISIKSGESHTLMITRFGELLGMGSNQNGQLGFNKNIEHIPVPSVIYFQTKEQIKQISCGTEHSFAVSVNNELFGWGLNLRGQLGLGDFENRREPERIALDKIFQKNELIVDIQCGPLHSVIISNLNRGYSCGYNNTYALCQQDNLDSNTFIEINQLKNIISDDQIQIRCGLSCTGFLASNKIYVQGTVAQAKKSIMFKSITLIDQVHQFIDFVIGNYFICGLSFQGDVYTLGDNMFGQLAQPQSIVQSEKFTKVEFVSQVQNIYCGSNHVIALAADKIFAWGNNQQNQINQQLTQQFYQPVELDFLKPQDIQIITCGDFHTLCLSNKQLNINKPEKKNSTPNEEEINLIITKQKRENDQLIKKTNQLQNELDIQKVELNQEKIKNKYNEQKLKDIKYQNQVVPKKDISCQTNTNDQDNNNVPNNQINIKPMEKKVDKDGKKLPEIRQFNISLEIDFIEIKLEKQIGEGGYGKIHQGKWRELTVAVKMLKPQAINDIVIRDFLSECKAMETFRHPNICMFLGACTKPPNFALVLEYCSRGSLMNLIQNKEITLSWDDKKRLALETCYALNYLHSFDPPILHRDLKSLNLLVDEFFRIKLADFGWTKILDNYMTGKIGTYQWMAPEVIQMYNYTEKADVYSFGIILWEISAREPPFRNISGSNVAKEVIANDLRPTIPEKVPKNLQKLIRRCWDRDPSLRPSFKEIIQELQSYKF